MNFRNTIIGFVDLAIVVAAMLIVVSIFYGLSIIPEAFIPQFLVGVLLVLVSFATGIGGWCIMRNIEEHLKKLVEAKN